MLYSFSVVDNFLVVTDELGNEVTNEAAKNVSFVVSRNQQILYLRGVNNEDNIGYSNKEEFMVDELSGGLEAIKSFLRKNTGFNSAAGGSAALEGEYYQPNFEIENIFPLIVSLNATSVIQLKGSFLDYITNITLNAADMSGVSFNVVSKDFDAIVLELVSNGVEQEYSFSFESFLKSESFTVESKSFDIYVPSLNGSGAGLWNKGTIASNGVVLEDGVFEAEATTGNGWNEHAYFGTFSSDTRIEFEMEIERIAAAGTNAYCFVRTNTSNAATTNGNPYVYVQNGVNLTGNSPSNSSVVSQSAAVGDIIKIVHEPNKWEVFKNGVSVGAYNGTTPMQNVYLNFTAYRVMKFKNINVKVY